MFFSFFFFFENLFEVKWKKKENLLCLDLTKSACLNCSFCIKSVMKWIKLAVWHKLALHTKSLHSFSCNIENLDDGNTLTIY